MLNTKQVPILWCHSKRFLDELFRVLNLITTRMQVVFSAKVVVNEMIAECFHIGATARFGGAVGIWRSEVCWVLACKARQCLGFEHKEVWCVPHTNNVCDHTFVLQHFNLSELAWYLGQPDVVESMGTNLMAFVHHASDEVEPLLRRINLSFAVVVSSDEECGFRIVGCEEVEKFTGMLARAIIICQRNFTLLKAMFDSFVV